MGSNHTNDHHDLRELSGILWQSDHAMVLATPDGTITSWSEGARQLWGYDVHEAVDRNVSFLGLPGRPGPSSADLVSRVATTARPIQVRTLGRHKDRRVVDLHLQIAPVKGATGGVDGLWAVMHAARGELTLQELRESEPRMPDEHALQDYASFDRLRGRLVTAVSHEFRTPLTAIVGFAELVRDHGTDLTVEDIRAYADRTLVNARRLEHIVDQILDLREAECGALTTAPQPIDLGVLVEQEVAARDWSRRHCHTRIQPVQLVVEPERIQRMLRELLDNIDRHTEPSNSVWIEVVVDQDVAVLTMDDDGEGWSEELRATALEPFTWGHGFVTNPSPGLGLGLAVVAAYARLYGGSTVVADSEHGGARIEVRIPLRPSAPTTSGF